MTTRDLAPKGAPTWIDLWTSDVAGSRTFYPALFGWEAWFVGVIAAGFDAIVNERANGWRWPKGTARYNLAVLRELPVLVDCEAALVVLVWLMRVAGRDRR